MRTTVLNLGRILISICLLAGLRWATLPDSSTIASEPQPSLIISEFMATNQASLIDEDGESSDWIEIYNPGAQAINLAGWSLTDDPQQPQKWSFPDVSLAGQAYLIVFASGKNRKPLEPDAELHTNFKLSRGGEYLGLYNIWANEFKDIVTPPLALPTKARPYPAYTKQVPDIAYGRYNINSDNTTRLQPYGYLTHPTPGEPNDYASHRIGLVDTVTFSVKRGFYDNAFTVELSTATPNATIKYTLDGSQPSEEHGVTYTTAITIDGTTTVRAVAFRPGFLSSATDTHTYLFLNDVFKQSNDMPGWPKTWGAYEGEPVKADYEMDPNILNDPRYSNIITDALKSIPSVSIVTDKRSFFDLYTNSTRRGRAWERTASVEYFDPKDQKSGFQINAGLRIQGQLGRSAAMPKHSLRLFFRGEYGATKLKYPLFEGSPVTKFETLILRGGVNKSYAGWFESDYEWSTYTRDEWLRASQIAMSGSGSHGMFVHLYLNGLYWGLYNLVERPDAAFMAAYFGEDEIDWDWINHSETTSTSSERYRILHELASEGQFDNPKRYAEIQSYLDIPHLIDYTILNWYAGNVDWAVNNWYAGVERTSGQVKYYVWDGERTWFEGAEILMEDGDEYHGQPDLVTPLFNQLFKNRDFQIVVADRIYKHLFNNGALNTTNSQIRWQQLTNTVEQAVIAESARWGDTRQEPPLTQADWFVARNDVLNQMAGNIAQFVRLAREQNYYPHLDPPTFNQHGGQITPGFTLTMTHPITQGSTIYYTTDGSDPRLAVSGDIAPTAKAYHAPLTLINTTQIKTRAYKRKGSDVTWSALNETVFSTATPVLRLSISEIMYNPPDGQDYEFIELTNTGNVALNLSNLHFAKGIEFTFPATPDYLLPNEALVLVRNSQAFHEKYPDISIDGEYDGRLSNKGELITIKDAQGSIITALSYDDENGWPLSADGHGDSLVLIDPDLDPNVPESWQASKDIRGSPGRTSFRPHSRATR